MEQNGREDRKGMEVHKGMGNERKGKVQMTLKVEVKRKSKEREGRVRVGEMPKRGEGKERGKVIRERGGRDRRKGRGMRG